MSIFPKEHIPAATATVKRPNLPASLAMYPLLHKLTQRRPPNPAPELATALVGQSSMVRAQLRYRFQHFLCSDVWNRHGRVSCYCLGKRCIAAVKPATDAICKQDRLCHLTLSLACFRLLVKTIMAAEIHGC